MTGIEGLSQVQNIAVQDHKDDMPVCDPNYIPNIDEPMVDFDPSDSSGIDSPSGSPSSPPPGPSGTNPSGANYLENSDKYNEEVGSGGGSYPTDGPGPSGGTGGTDDDAYDTASNLDGLEDDLFSDENLDPNKYIGQDGDYQTVDAEALYEFLWMHKALVNLRIALALIMDGKEDIRDLIDEIITGVSVDKDAMNEVREQTLKKIELTLKGAAEFVQKIIKRVLQHNYEVYMRKMQEIEQEVEDRGCGEDFENWITGGGLDIEAEEAKLEATEEYWRVTMKILAAYRQVLGMLATDITRYGDKQLDGIGKAFEDFGNRVDQASALMNSSGDWEDKDFFDEDDMANLFQNILNDVRYYMMCFENIYRAMVAARAAKEDLNAAIQEELFPERMPASKAEYGFVGAKGLFNTSNIFFDATYNNLMLAVKKYNDAVQLSENIESLEDAQVWGVFGAVLSIVAILAAIVATCLTFGGASATVVAAFAIAAAVAGITSGICSGIGSYLASLTDDTFDVEDPAYSAGVDLTKKRGKTGDKTLDFMNELDRLEEQLANNLGNQGLFVEQEDGYFSINAAAFGSFGWQQATLHNIMKAIIYVDKAKRDLNRAVSATVAGKTIRDHGEAHLVSNLDTILHQRTLMTNAIQFKIQEKLIAKNMIVQSEKMADNALTSIVSGMIGTIVGFVVGLFIPGGFALCLGIGSALGNAIGQMINAFRSDSGLGMDYKVGETRSFDELVAAKAKYNQKVQNCAEAKLERIEFQIFQNLLLNGLVDVGDGYINVDYALVGKVYSVLGKIQAIRDALAKVRAAKTQMKGAVSQETLGVSGLSDTSILHAYAKTAFSKSMAIMQAVAKQLQERASVHNRARNAEKKAVMAAVNLGVTVVTSAVGAGVAAAGATGTSEAVKMAGEVAKSITPGVMGLINSVFSFIMSAISGTDDYGAYSDYNESESAKGPKSKKDGKTAEEILMELQEQAYAEAGKNLMSVMSGGQQVLDGGLAATLSHRVDALNNIKEALMMLADAKKDLKSDVARALGMSQAVNVSVSDMASHQASIAQSIMNSMIQGVQVIIERNNQISAAERQMWISALGAILSAASIALGAAAACKGVEANQEADEMEKGTGNTGSASSEASDSTDASKSPAETPGQATGIDPAAQTVADAAAVPDSVGESSTETTADKGVDGPKAKAAAAKETAAAAEGAAKQNPAAIEEGAGAKPGDKSASKTKAKTAKIAKAKAVAAKETAAAAEVAAKQNPAAIEEGAETEPGDKSESKAKTKTAKTANGRPLVSKDAQASSVRDGAKINVVKSESRKQKIQRLIEERKWLSFASAVCSLLGTLNNYVTGAVWDAVAESNAEESSISSSALDVKKSRKNQSSSGGGLASAIDSLETDAAQSEINAAGYATSVGADIALRNAEQMVKTFLDSIKGALSVVDTFGKPKTKGFYWKKGELEAISTVNMLQADPKEIAGRVASFDDDEVVRFVDELKEKVKAGFPQDKANRIIEEIQKLKPELHLETIAAGAAVQPNQVVPAPRSNKFNKVEEAKSSSKGTQEYAQKLLNERAAKIDQQVQQLQETQRKIQRQMKVDEQLDKVDPTKKKGSDVEIGTKVEVVADTLKKKLNALTKREEDIQKELDRLPKIESLNEQIKSLEELKGKTEKYVKARLSEIDKCLKDLQEKGKGKLEGEDLKTYQMLKDERDRLKRSSHKEIQDVDIQKLKKQRDEIKTKRQHLTRELVRVKDQIKNIKEQLTKQAKLDEQPSGKQKDGHDKVVGLKQSGHGKHGQGRQQQNHNPWKSYEDAVRDAEVLAKHSKEEESNLIAVG